MANQNNPRLPGDDDENDVNHRARSYGDEPDFEHDDDFAGVLDDLEDGLDDDGLDDYDDDLEDDLDDDLDDDLRRRYRG